MCVCVCIVVFLLFILNSLLPQYIYVCMCLYIQSAPVALRAQCASHILLIPVPKVKTPQFYVILLLFFLILKVSSPALGSSGICLVSVLLLRDLFIQEAVINQINPFCSCSIRFHKYTTYLSIVLTLHIYLQKWWIFHCYN